MPDHPTVRGDILDYYEEVQRFDQELAALVEELEQAGTLDKTLLVVTSDNGMPFPRCKTNMYDSGSHMPLAIRWPAKVKAGTVIEQFVSLVDLAPTFVEAAGAKPEEEMTGDSLVGLLTGSETAGRNAVFIERERHANVRRGDLSYPSRAIRTEEFLYIRNLRPDRWPAGDPKIWKAVGPFGDVDGSPTKELMLNERGDPGLQPLCLLSFGQRPQEELYHLGTDGDQIKNVAEQAEYQAAKKHLRARLEKWMQDTGDPRITDPLRESWDQYPYFGGGPDGR